MSKDDPYAWWKAALAGNRPPTTTEPECGYYLRPIERGEDGERKFLPARIYWAAQFDEDGERLQDDILCCDVAGTQCDPVAAWAWLSGRPITKAEYDERLSLCFYDSLEERSWPLNLNQLS